MSDSKTPYSAASKRYVEHDVLQSDLDSRRYARSKDRESRFGVNWEKFRVNINEVVDRFTPGARGRREGVKFVFEGERYLIKADMVSGCLRIYDKVARSYVLLNGIPCNDNSLTHFKILRREEM